VLLLLRALNSIIYLFSIKICSDSPPPAAEFSRLWGAFIFGQFCATIMWAHELWPRPSTPRIPNLTARQRQMIYSICAMKRKLFVCSLAAEVRCVNQSRESWILLPGNNNLNSICTWQWPRYIYGDPGGQTEFEYLTWCCALLRLIEIERIWIHSRSAAIYFPWTSQL